MAEWTYKTDDGLYDVHKLSETAQTSFQYLAEVEAEVQTLMKRVDVLRAAGQTYNQIIQSELNEEALIDDPEPQGELVE